jgi:hypothetical protein
MRYVLATVVAIVTSLTFALRPAPAVAAQRRGTGGAFGIRRRTWWLVAALVVAGALLVAGFATPAHAGGGYLCCV